MNEHMAIDTSGDSSPASSKNTIDVQMARRRLLLNSALKGTAVAASAVPIKTLALTSSVTVGGQICSASGVESVAHSRATGLQTCQGKSPSFFKTLSNWRGYSNPPPTATFVVGSATFTQKSTFSSVFGSGSSFGNNKLFEIVNNNGASDEAYWIAALLNAVKPMSGAVFPYSPAEVLALYSGSQAASAIKLFKLINSAA